MRLLHQVSVAVFAGALVVVTNSADAQRGPRREPTVMQSRVPMVYDDRWDDDRRRSRNDVRGRRRGQDEAWYRRQQAQREAWCRRHRSDRRCAELFRRRDGANWCWDVNRDRRCDNFDNRRRDSRPAVWGRDRGPEWERWLRSNGVDVNALLTRPR